MREYYCAIGSVVNRDLARKRRILINREYGREIVILPALWAVDAGEFHSL
jgi:hypothetical protein